MTANEKRQRILVLWDIAEEEFPDKSTPFLMQIVCDRYLNQYHHEIDHGDVAEALENDKP
jgi:hypothetical protein